jgi:hypothetical protein
MLGSSFGLRLEANSVRLGILGSEERSQGNIRHFKFRSGCEKLRQVWLNPAGF